VEVKGAKVSVFAGVQKLVMVSWLMVLKHERRRNTPTSLLSLEEKRKEINKGLNSLETCSVKRKTKSRTAMSGFLLLFLGKKVIGL
jgi:hypothetical protein